MCLLVLILYIPINNFSAGIKCLAQGHNAVPQVWLKPAAPSISSQALYHRAPLPFVSVGHKPKKLILTVCHSDVLPKEFLKAL